LVSEILKELENTNAQEKKMRLKTLLKALGAGNIFKRD